jgi:hypothetical protein
VTNPRATALIARRSATGSKQKSATGSKQKSATGSRQNRLLTTVAGYAMLRIGIFD